MTKKLLLPLIAIFVVLLAISGWQYADGRAIELRKNKASELRTYLQDYEQHKKTGSMIQKELGPPDEIVKDKGYIDGHQIATLYKYHYQFRTLPWSRPYSVWLEISFDVNGFVADYSVLQSFG